ncbi:hypothetical protein F9288_13485 [Sphingomonas sp. CL5.1]|uniref:putative quinol monooxygenase n=1 Tax=Sphingomonas sp. CL5.1 TaxID=2653203 RepID=UPI00158148F7|nr:hypothetical protein [Sphingomonas sp. CL5.1]QKS00518.1 hypothetical protein F9288_13485 [Sphingomonas sp. CL5.1]
MKGPLHAFDYRFLPLPGQMDALVEALHALGAEMIGRPGLIGVQILVDREHDACYFVEKWTSPEARAEAGAVLPGELGAAMALSREKPRATELICYDIA